MARCGDLYDTVNVRDVAQRAMGRSRGPNRDEVPLRMVCECLADNVGNVASPTKSADVGRVFENAAFPQLPYEWWSVHVGKLYQGLSDAFRKIVVVRQLDRGFDIDGVEVLPASDLFLP